PFPAPDGEAVIGLNAIIIAVTDEVPRILTVSRASHALATPAQMGEPAADADSPIALPFGPFEPHRHRTLELGLHDWVAEQTGLGLGYVEQLYTFGDRFRDPREQSGGPRLVSVGYIALVRQAPLSGAGAAEWHNWYDFLPWEDWRDGKPALIDSEILPRLEAWAAGLDDAVAHAEAVDRIALTFGLDKAAWDFERTLERYELLYEAGLIVEALRDRQAAARLDGRDEPVDEGALAEAARLGAPMALDNRRILATALGRIRGKLKYRPVVFELLPATFTLLTLQRTVEALGGVRLHKQNFRRLVLTGGLVEPTGRQSAPARGRPAELYRFRREVLRERTAAGIGLPAAR
ncbi:unnamed protein product, partial [Discosporangium mesarthrocarpum]